MTPSDDTLLQAYISVPEHVVRRRFAEEAVALNLESGQYHGLNPIAAAMLDALEAGATGDEVARQLADEYEQPEDRVRTDLLALVQALADRGLVEVDDTRPD